MHKIYLHIGHGKTGTSFIQSFLSLNIKPLKENYGIFYPVNDSGQFQKMKKGHVTDGNGHILKSLNLDKHIFSNNVTLFSHEGFFRTFFEEENIQKLLKKNKSQLKIFIYSRNVIEYLVSIWQQSLKAGRTSLGFNEYIIKEKISTYSLLIDRLMFFKNNNIDYVIRNYSSHKNNLVQTFLKDLLLTKFDYGDFNTPSYDIVNRSHDLFEIELIKQYNSLNLRNKNYIPGKRFELFDEFINFNPNIKPFKPKLEISTYEHIKQNYEQDVHSLNNLIPSEEKVIIEDFNNYNLDKKDTEPKNLFNIKKPQIKTLSAYLHRLNKQSLKPDQIKFLIGLAKQLHSSRNPKALTLMRIVKQVKPKGPAINKLFEEYLETNSKKK